MYSVTIYDTQKKKFKTYEHIHTIKYFSLLQKWEVFTDDKEILNHPFPCLCSYQLISDNANYCIDRSIIGSIEIKRKI